jgi:acyl-CoA synthetase (NDP forming)
VTSELAQYLFSPRSVAIIGQSDDPGKAAGRPLKFLRQMGYAGRVYPINPRRETVLGERAWPRISALPDIPDHAYIVLATDAAVEAVEECAEFGVKVATVLADGFAEAGPEGLAREARLRALCARTGIRVVGPSSLGVVDLRTRSMLTANAALDERDLPVGRTFVASHSGSMIGALLSRGNARGARFAALVSVGNEIDLSLGEICEAVVGDADIDGYMLFLETLRHADALRRFALKAAQAGKPVIAYKLGRSAAARELAVSHTGALAGEDDIADVFLRACGIARVDTLEGLIEGALLLSRVPAAHARGARANVGVVTTTAGGATMVVDPLARRGINIETPRAATLAKFAAAGIEVKPARIIDLTIAGARYESMKAALDILVAAPEFDLVLAAIGSSARHYPQATVRPLIECAGKGSPLAVFLVPEAPEALAALSQAGVPNFHTPEACADAVAAALARRAPVPITINARRGAGCHARTSEKTRVLDELASGALIDRLGIARAPAVALGADIREAPRLPFAYPVAVKVLSAEIAHKTEVGGVALNVGDADALLAAIAEMRANLGRRVPALTLHGVLVQPMLSGVAEVLIGYRVDRDVGPLIMVAAGGVLAEIERDRSLRLAPIDMAAAHEMVADLRSLPLLCGYRGRPKGDLGALARALVALSQLAHDDSILEAEINPLLVLPEGKGVVALDALVRLK